MGQQFKGDEATRKIKREGVIRPQDDVTVYATAKVEGSKNNDYKEGDEIVVHSALAEKLVAMGKATKEAPKGKTAKTKEA